MMGLYLKDFKFKKIKEPFKKNWKKLLEKLQVKKNRIIASGRTDSGVHANEMYVNFLTAKDIRADKFHYHLKKYLPEDILALSSKKVDKNFHARFSVKTKTYKYVISLEKILHPIYRNYMEQITYKLDFDKLKQGMEILKGEHDFRAFMLSEKNDIINTIRKIDDCYYILDNNILFLYFKAESFLHNQVRIMAGSLIELSRGKISLDDFKFYFDKNNKKRANPTLKAGGLYLEIGRAHV